MHVHVHVHVLCTHICMHAHAPPVRPLHCLHCTACTALPALHCLTVCLSLRGVWTVLKGGAETGGCSRVLNGGAEAGC